MNTKHGLCTVFIEDRHTHWVKDRKFLSILLNNFKVFVLHHQGKFVIRQTLISLLGNVFLVFPVRLDNAVLLQQGIFKPVVHDYHAGVVVQEDVVQVVCDLFSASLIAGASWVCHHNLVRTCKDSHQCWHCAINGFCYLTSNDRRFAFDLVAVRLAQVGLKCLLALFYGFALNETDGVVDFSLEDRF